MLGTSPEDRAVVELYPLSRQPGEDGLQELGRAETGTFVALPQEGVDLIEWMAAGLPLEQVKARFGERYGEPADLADFLEQLTDLGFVRSVDGRAVEDLRPGAQPPRRRGWQLFATVPQERVAWLLSTPMKVLYLAIWLAVPVLLALHPELVPSATDGLFHARTIVNIAGLVALGWSLMFVHEMAHVLTAKAIGCASSLTISHRLHFVVAQTDMTAVRSQPPSRRYGPYLAGMTLDLGVLLMSMALRLAGVEWSLLAALSYVVVMSLLFQFAFFMRTDVYYVFANWLRLGNLMEDTRHWLADGARRAVRRPLRHDLSLIPAREYRVVRWYSVFYVVGVTVAVGNFVVYGLPVAGEFLARSFDGLTLGPSSTAFWDGILFLALFTINFGLLGFVIRSERRTRRSVAAARPT